MTRATALSMIKSRAIPLIVATALFMENLDSTVIATSLPKIAQDLGTSPIHLKLALTSYLLALAIFIPASGWMADRFGARSVFRLAILVFATGSIACGASSSLFWLVCARVLQGIGGSMMVPVGRLIVLRTTPKSALVDALAWLTMPALLGPVMGPPLGGFITTYFDWRWIFWINIPIAALGVTLVTLFIPRVRAEATRAFDALGFLLVGPGLAAFLTGVTMAGLGLSSMAVMLGLTFGGLALVLLYIRHAGRVEAPLVDLTLFSLPTFRAAALGGSLFRIGGGAQPFLLPLMLQLGFGYSPFQSGLVTLATGAGALTLKFGAQRILNRFGFRRILIVNAVLGSLFLLAPASFTAATPYAAMVGVLFIGGICRSLEFTSISAIAYSEITSDRMSSATSFNSVLQQLSRSIGITVAAFALQGVQSYRDTAQITAASFPPVFWMIAGVSIASVIWFLRLSPDAGGQLLSRRSSEGRA
ncbi:DHA2 family efflux MFS transporter permease subunit [Solirhodobacter olei]|uniref:DHA2 family efflux MFS transporter permease subunit n=1 Tax=Solirhodobacter olei TaxID=2493082 RepID=UPI001F4D762D|nr:DHA2 family efflux MFS transporter permease subunit [Solirhodobacter olei]